MVYFASYEEFRDASRELFARSPREVRYTCKYRNPSEETPEVVLKVTDNRACLMFRVTQQADMKYVDQFTQLFAAWSVMDDVSDDYGFPVDTATAFKRLAGATGSPTPSASRHGHSGDATFKGGTADMSTAKGRKKKRKAA